MNKRICTKCNQEKMLNDFYFNKKLNRYVCHCRACQTKNRLIYRENNPEKDKATWERFRDSHKEQRKEYQKNRKRMHKFKLLATWHNTRCKSKPREKIITPNQLWSLAKKQKLICPISGDKLTSENVSIDHIIPRVKGGSDLIENLQLVTWEANNMKQDLLEKDFFKLVEKIYNYQNRISA